MLALGARVLADGVGFGRLVGGWMSRVHRYGRRCRGAWQTGCEPVLSCNGKNGNGEEHHRAVHEPPLRLYLAWSAGMDGCVMATSVGAAANAKGWIAPADSGVMIEDGVGPRRAVHEPPLRLYLAWSAGTDGCVMRTSVGAAAIAKGWIAPADCGVMIEDGVGPRRAVHEPPLRVCLAWSAGMDGCVMRTSVGAAASQVAHDGQFTNRLYGRRWYDYR